MRFIAHRGNLNGPIPERENHPSYIQSAISSGFDVEIDVWYQNEKFILGHDKPDYEVGYQFFYNDRLWVHCKNIEALRKLVTNPLVNAFYHDQDDCVLTSQGFIWTYPRLLTLTDKSIAVMPERVPEWDLTGIYAVCSDYVSELKKNISFKPEVGI